MAPSSRYFRNRSIDNGDILVSWSATLDAFVWQRGPAWLNQHIFKIIPNSGVVSKDFLFNLLKYEIQNLLKTDHLHGSTMKHINRGPFLAHAIGLPPIREQRRIEFKLSSLLTRSGKARDELAHIPRLIERYKQAILSAAFRGDLTADWRKRNNISTRWTQYKLADISKVGTGATPKRGTPKYYQNGDIPWVTSSVANNEFVTSAEEFITNVALQESNCKIYPAGTLLIAMYGEGKTRGMVTRLSISAATNQALAAVQVNNDIASSDFVYWFLKANYLKLRSEASGGVQPNLNLSIIKSLLIPTPSIAEQEQIVLSLNHSFSKIELALSHMLAASKNIDVLNENIMQKAFRGDLVAQDPTDEPAAALLARTQSQAATAPAVKQKRKRSA